MRQHGTGHGTRQRTLALRKLRDLLRGATGLTEPMFVVLAADRYRLDPALITTDIAHFQAALDTACHAPDDTTRLAAYQEAAALYRGPLADGAGYEWAEPYAETARRRALDTWTAIAELLEPTHPDQALAAAYDDRGALFGTPAVAPAAPFIGSDAWREIGADGRICDLIDSQVSAIEGACGKIAAADPTPFLNAAFDLLEGRIKAFDESESEAPRPAEEPARQATEEVAAEEAAASVAEEPIQSPAPAMHDEVPAAVEDRAPAASMANDVEAVMAAEPIMPMAEATEVRAEAAEAVAFGCMRTRTDYVAGAVVNASEAWRPGSMP